MSDRHFKVTVGAKRDSTARGTESGAQVGPIAIGDMVVINTNPKDTWNVSSGSAQYEVNANGSPDSISSRNKQNFRNGSLVGSLDGGDTFFAIGTRAQVMVLAATDNGKNPNLRLYCWDSDFENNSGEIEVHINVVPGEAI